MLRAMMTHLRSALDATEQAASVLPDQLATVREAVTSGVAKLTTTTAVLAAGVLLALAIALAALIRAH